MLRRFAQHPFVRNVAILSSGQAMAQALAIAASPILTRLYDPDAFGAFGLLIAFSATLIVVSGLRYELAIVTAKDDESAANLLILSCGLVLLVSGLSALLPSLAGTMIADLVERPGFGTLMWWLPLLTLAGGSYQALSYWTTRRKHYTHLAVSRVVQSLGALGTQIMAGLADLGARGLIGGRVLGTTLSASILAVQVWRHDWAVLRAALKAPRLKEVAKENARFPKYNAPQNLINSVSKALVPFTLAPFFGVEIVGFYYLAERVLNTPSTLVSGSVRRVFYQRASERYNQGKSFRRLLLMTYAGLFSVGVVPLALLVGFGPELFSFVFGAEWRKAGTMSQWLAVWWFLAFVTAPSSETLIILKLQKYLLYYQTSLASARFLAILIGATYGDDITAIAACSLVGLAFNFSLMVVAVVHVHRHPGPPDDPGAAKVPEPAR